MIRIPMWISLAQAVGERSNQEDAYGHSSTDALDTEKRGCLFVLCDGMGGMEQGERFSSIGVMKMIETFEKQDGTEPLPERLSSCYNEANQASIRLRTEEQLNGGSTVVAVAIQGFRCAFLSVGDSLIVLVRGNEIIRLNRFHTLGDALDLRAALGYISEEDAKLSEKRQALVNCLGQEGKEPDIGEGTFTLIQGDRIALMSDGVYGTLTDNELSALLSRKTHSDEYDIADNIIDAVLKKKKKKQDNCSILIVEYGTAEELEE